MASSNHALVSDLRSDSHLPNKILFTCFNESPLMIKNAYFILKAFFVLKILKFLS